MIARANQQCSYKPFKKTDVLTVKDRFILTAFLSLPYFSYIPVVIQLTEWETPAGSWFGHVPNPFNLTILWLQVPFRCVFDEVQYS